MLLTFLVAYAAALIATPLAIRVARRTGFLDRPVGYKGHGRPTPYLGGSAVLVGFLAGGFFQGALANRLVPLLACAVLIWIVGTVDDAVPLRPWVRVLAEAGAATLLWMGDLGWSLFPEAPVLDLLVTIVWIVAVVNAFNLMDNQDGAATTVAAVSAGGIALLSLDSGTEALTALAVSLCGACVGFLHFNLTRPARIFLGDGGSMLLGFLVALLAMRTTEASGTEGIEILPAILLVGLPLLDMALVMVSRTRRGLSVVTGGRDHTTHRLLRMLGSPRWVALALALAQAALCAAAIGLLGWDREAMIAGVVASLLLGALTIAILELPMFSSERAAGVDSRSALAPGGSGYSPPSSSGADHEETRTGRSTSTPWSDGATSGRSAPSTKLGP